eukprot:11159273-Lingulodinium_polyedra.AAC.1
MAMAVLMAAAVSALRMLFQHTTLGHAYLTCNSVVMCNLRIQTKSCPRLARKSYYRSMEY